MTDQALTYHASEDVAKSRSTTSGALRALIRTGPASSALFLRLALAVAIFPHGAQKLLGWFGGAGFSGTITAFQQYFGIPAPLAFVAIITEFFAPLLLVAGLFTRVGALAIAGVMFVAMRFHFANGFFMNWYGNQAGEGFEYHILAIGIALALALSGGGRWSADRSITRLMER
jgi:putative oxidoreductase